VNDESLTTVHAAPAPSTAVAHASHRSALFDEHVALGAKLTDFGGWEMPLCYPDGTIAEHRACRTRAAIFDVSHLGTVRVSGPDALARLQVALTNDLARVGPGHAQYTHLLDDDGGVLDDLIVWWLDEDTFVVMPNASNTSAVLAALGGTDTTATRAVLAVQGPGARSVVGAVLPDAAEVARFTVARAVLGGDSCVVAGTGYTGEDGLEIAVPAESAVALWRALVAAGAVPAGLGARDTLRLEAGLPLHGHELGPGITPLQAGLGWVVAWGKPSFRGRDALVAERERGPRRHLVGVATDERRPPRAGDSLAVGSGIRGVVTSGNFSPMLGHGIALALVDGPAPTPGTPVVVTTRREPLTGRVAVTPFVRPGQFAPGAGLAPD
jgi:aminomethyltransferase